MENIEEYCLEMRRRIVRSLHRAGSGHPGSSLSCVEILAVLFNRVMRHTFEMDNPDRDRFVLSKGHAAPALYALFSMNGVISEDELFSLRTLGSRLPGHVSRIHLPEVEFATGSLGQGISAAQGMALASKIDGRSARAFVLIGDGEFQEGQVWETLMSAPHFGLDNFIVILDYNKGQIDGHVREIMPIEPIVDKVKSFNWEVFEVDGHNCDAIEEVINRAPSEGRPRFVVADTVKGKGVSFMEDAIEWHGKAPGDEDFLKAMEELKG